MSRCNSFDCFPSNNVRICKRQVANFIQIWRYYSLSNDWERCNFGIRRVHHGWNIVQYSNWSNRQWMADLESNWLVLENNCAFNSVEVKWVSRIDIQHHWHSNAKLYRIGRRQLFRCRTKRLIIAGKYVELFTMLRKSREHNNIRQVRRLIRLKPGLEYWTMYWRELQVTRWN